MISLITHQIYSIITLLLTNLIIFLYYKEKYYFYALTWVGYQFVENIMICLELLPVIEKPEILLTKEKRVKSFVDKYVVKL